MSNDGVELESLKSELLKMDQTTNNNSKLTELESSINKLKELESRFEKLESKLDKFINMYSVFKVSDGVVKFTKPVQLEVPGVNSNDAVNYSQLKEIKDICFMIVDVFGRQIRNLRDKL